MKNAQDGMREKRIPEVVLPHPPLPSQHPAGAADLPGSAFALRGIVHSALDGRGRISAGRAVGGLSP